MTHRKVLFILLPRKRVEDGLRSLLKPAPTRIITTTANGERSTTPSSCTMCACWNTLTKKGCVHFHVTPRSRAIGRAGVIEAVVWLSAHLTEHSHPLQILQSLQMHLAIGAEMPESSGFCLTCKAEERSKYFTALNCRPPFC